MKKITKNYINNKDFYDAIVLHRNSCQEAIEQGKETPRIPDYIGVCIMTIANRLSLKPCFRNYSFRDEMISDAIENAFAYYHDFNPFYGLERGIKPNPFAYFTQVVYFAFLRRLYKEEKNRYIIYKNFHDVIGPGSDTSGLVDSDNKSLMPAQMYDNIGIFMEKFERKEALKNQKRKPTKLSGLDNFYEKEL